MPILNYTTQVDAHRTVSEIQLILAKKGAKRVLIEYGPQGEPTALIFQIDLKGDALHFRLPCRQEQVLKRLQRDASVERRFKTPQQALKVAWRIIKDWIEAQLALVEAEQAELAEVFLPYGVTKSGETVYQQMIRTRYLLTTHEEG